MIASAAGTRRAAHPPLAHQKGDALRHPLLKLWQTLIRQLFGVKQFFSEQLGLGGGRVRSFLLDVFAESLFLVGDRVLRVIGATVSDERRRRRKPVRTIDSANDIRFDGMLDIVRGLHGVVCRAARVLGSSIGVGLDHVCPTIVVMVPATRAEQTGTHQHQQVSQSLHGRTSLKFIGSRN
ncbi:MAG TPA: hypothetical protein VG056_12235 [Pirellulales bacterium]|nr:hypothetical protein [Pirellulales bacterium]